MVNSFVPLLNVTIKKNLGDLKNIFGHILTKDIKN